MPFVTGLFVYPVKSLKGIEVSSAEVGAEGTLTLSLAEHTHLTRAFLHVLYLHSLCFAEHCQAFGGKCKQELMPGRCCAGPEE
jgi:hypothetical protein